MTTWDTLSKHHLLQMTLQLFSVSVLDCPQQLVPHPLSLSLPLPLSLSHRYESILDFHARHYTDYTRMRIVEMIT